MKMLTAVAALTALACSPALASGCNDSAARAAKTTATSLTAGSGAGQTGWQAVRHTTTATAAAASDIVGVASGAGQFSTLVAAVQAAGLVPTLRGPGPFTVFAPTDAAFARLAPGTVQMLLKPENRAQLTAILTYHVVPGRITASQLTGRQTSVATVEGRSVNADGRQGVTINNARVISADVQASNGIIHVIDTVLLPPERASAQRRH
jgi:uncharacterized surface protein with fasciclin (FAS1) repeats